MSKLNTPAFPSTSEMLNMTRLQKKRGLFAMEKTDRYVFGVGALLILLIVLFLAAESAGWMATRHAKHIVIPLYSTLFVIYASYIVFQLFEIFKQLKSGFKHAADSTDDRIAHEENIIRGLAIYPRGLVREKAQLLDLEAKRWMRRSGMGAAFGAAFAAGINLLGAIIKSSDMQATSEVPSTIAYVLMFGLLLGSAMVFSFAAKLEKVAGILSIAASRERLFVETK